MTLSYVVHSVCSVSDMALSMRQLCHNSTEHGAESTSLVNHGMLASPCGTLLRKTKHSCHSLWCNPSHPSNLRQVNNGRRTLAISAGYRGVLHALAPHLAHLHLSPHAHLPSSQWHVLVLPRGKHVAATAGQINQGSSSCNIRTRRVGCCMLRMGTAAGSEAYLPCRCGLHMGTGQHKASPHAVYYIASTTAPGWHTVEYTAAQLGDSGIISHCHLPGVRDSRVIVSQSPWCMAFYGMPALAHFSMLCMHTHQIEWRGNTLGSESKSHCKCDTCSAVSNCTPGGLLCMH